MPWILRTMLPVSPATLRDIRRRSAIN
jgi:hypothetical protein